MNAESAVDRVLGSSVVGRTVTWATRRRLRVLAYHGIARPSVFDAQMAWVRRNLVPVSLAEVAGTAPLPPRAVWVTFDDGDPSVVTAALPSLERHGIRATMFVCPGVIGTRRPFWWQVVDAAVPAGSGAEISRLKRESDDVRRAAVATLESSAEIERDQLTIDQLRAFAATGDVGNHTWDHPILDRCDEVEQRRQIRSAHEWLADALGAEPMAFAYPNGNDTDVARDELRSLGYRVATLFDHRMARLERPLALSRLRVGDDATPERFAAIASGAHPALHALRQRRGRRA